MELGKLVQCLLVVVMVVVVMEGEHVHLHRHLASILNMCDRVYLGLVVSYTFNCTKEAR